MKGELSKVSGDNKLTVKEKQVIEKVFESIQKKLKTLPAAQLEPFKSDSMQGRPPKP